MFLTSTAIKRPIFIIMFVLALIVLGLQSRNKMPAELNPKVDIPYVTVITDYSGAGPSEIESLVSEPIEKAVTSTSNLKNVTSTSQDGISTVVLEFELGTDLESAAADVRDKVSAIRASLPKDADDPTIMKVDLSSMPVMTIGLAGTISPKEMRILADDTISDHLAKVGGVASVNVTGGDEREITVAVNKDRLNAYGIGIDKVVSAISAANMNVPAGSIKEGERSYSVRTVGEYKTAEEIANTRMFISGKNGASDTVVRIGDIAKITDSVAEADVLGRMNGKPSVLLTIQKQSDANTVSVCQGVKEQLKELQSSLPNGVHPIIATDQSKRVLDSLSDVNKSLLEGIILVVLIVFLFLHTVRATFIVGIAIPTSIFATYLPIGSMGFTLNQMTLLALSLVVGILVDDSIVVLENIERHLKNGEPTKEAALNGRTEIGLAAIAITMVDIVVFVPIGFMGGIIGQFFKQFGLTVACATAFSLFMSFTLTPMLASRWLKSEADKEEGEAEMKQRLQNGTAGFKDKLDSYAGVLFGGLERFIKGLDKKYMGVLEWALHNRYLTVVIGVISLLTVFAMAMPGSLMNGKPSPVRIVIALLSLVLAAFSLYHSHSKKVAIGYSLVMAVIALTIYLPFGFTMMPDTDQGQFVISIRTPPGSSLKATDKVVRDIEAVLNQVPEFRPVKYKVSDAVFYNPLTWFKHHTEVETGYYMSYVGTSSSGRAGSGSTGYQYARIEAQLVAKGRRHRSLKDIVDWINRRTAAIPGAEQIIVSASSGMGDTGISLEVQGHNMNDILKQANRLAGIMKKTPGAIDVDISYKASQPERRIIIDRTRAANMGMSLSTIANAARVAIDGDDDSKLREAGTEYPIRVRYDQDDRNKASDVENLIIDSKNGAPIRLKDVADIRYDNAPTKIDRKNRQRVVYVTANIANGFEMGNVSAAIMQNYQKSEKVPGTEVVTGGMGKIMAESFGYMGSALLLAIVLVYMLMGALFESFLTPFVIMFSLPMAMTGALLGLLLTGNSLSMSAMIGIIMLVGLVTKNAILLLDYTNTLRSRGLNRHEALLEAGPTRLRPILMTTLAMVGGMMPTALALSEGSEFRSPMAIAVIGGLIVSTMLTLIVIPVVYTVVDDSWQAVLRIFSPKSAKQTTLPAAEMEPASVGKDSE